MKKIKIKQESDNSVPVRVEATTKMAETVDKLLKMERDEFKKSISIAKAYRKANEKMAKLLGKDKIFSKLDSRTANAQIVNGLIRLEATEFKKTIRCAKKYRRASRIFDNAIAGYIGLIQEDEQKVQRKMRFAYE